MSTEGPFPGGKARPGRDADHSPPSSTEVERLLSVWWDCFTFFLNAEYSMPKAYQTTSDHISWLSACSARYKETHFLTVSRQ
jgi:hypothetical protein